MENLRYMLHQYSPQASLYFGHRYARKGFHSGYMAGGSYILSKEALKNFIGELNSNDSKCQKDENGVEDWEMGMCPRFLSIKSLSSHLAS